MSWIDMEVVLEKMMDIYDNTNNRDEMDCFQHWAQVLKKNSQ